MLGGCNAEQKPATNASTGSNPTVGPILAATTTPTQPPSTSEGAILATETPAVLPTSSPAEVADQTVSQPDQSEPTENVSGCSAEPYLDFFGHPDFDSLLAIMGCALADPLFNPVAINEFGEGPEYDRFMLWTSVNGMIYVLRPDSGWEIHADTWRADLPEIGCNPNNIEFASPPLPRRGFGKIWCELESLQSIMGTIEKEERLCQHAVLQRFENGQLLACFEDVTYRYFRIMDDKTWESVFIQ